MDDVWFKSLLLTMKLIENEASSNTLWHWYYN